MARGDGIHRTSARNMRLTAAKIGNAQQHNEREKESYVNQDIVPERTHLNVHFKKPTAGYAEMSEQLKKDGIISTRGLKEDAFLYGELVFDVNTAYFHNHGGYDFAKQFYTDAYKSAIEIVGGEQYILSAVMHADERNRAMSDALGQDVYHYHLHVVYIPVVEKQILSDVPACIVALSDETRHQSLSVCPPDFGLEVLLRHVVCTGLPIFQSAYRIHKISRRPLCVYALPVYTEQLLILIPH